MTQTFLPEGVFVRHPDKIFVGGEWFEPSTKDVFELVCPNTEQTVGAVTAAAPADMDKAVAAARKAFDEGPWPNLSPAERAGWLRKLGEALKKREPELATCWTAQVGGLSAMSPHTAAVATQAFFLQADLIEKHPFEEQHPTAFGHTTVVIRDPVGVVAAIAPWNAPYVIMGAKVASALAAGCAVVMKPAPETPFEAYIIAEAAEEIGMPPGVVNVVCGDRAASDYLVSNPGVDKVSFTGSTVAGRRIASVCGDRIARYTLELGGKSAAIVMDDFSADETAKVLASCITMFTGQICGMLTRAVVSKKRHDETAEAIAREMAKIVVGPSADPNTMMGPLAMARQRDRVEGYIQKGIEGGADLVCGGKRPEHLNRGYFFEPTLFANVDNKSVIAQEEIFGPVICLIPCEDEDDAVRIANDSPYGLYGSVFTHDRDTAYRVGKRMRTGGVGHNGMRVDPAAPLGGYKMSGIGREQGIEGLFSYLETKALYLLDE